MKKIVVGILAHVDAGKTTLSEGLLYSSGKIRKLGRVDNQDAYLDTDKMEKERGITIFSKQAVLEYKDLQITLLDTPGHVDFSSEMERTLSVLDYAILVVNGADGVQAHTKTLWRLLKRYGVPVFLFVNKMDQQGCEKEALLAEIKAELSDSCVDFSTMDTEAFFEEVAMSEEAAMEYFLEEGQLPSDMIKELIAKRMVFPCYFGSALKMTGVAEFLEGIYQWIKLPSYHDNFGAKVFKIARDEQNMRLTYLKVIGGTLKVRDLVGEEKVSQIRVYSGSKYEAIAEAEAGTVCAVIGLEHTKPGMVLGEGTPSLLPVLEPVLSYKILLPEDVAPVQMLPKLRMLEEEEPELHIIWNEALQEIHAQIMGEVQIEIIQRMVLERFGIEVTFGTGNIVYKETITNTVEGVGHFEPLRHYAEVHLLLEPGELGSGMQFCTDCSEDILAKNWQRLILTHLEEKQHVGVLTGSEITDIKITLINGRAHTKHTEGGDFRQSTYRAVRQGLMQAESVLLEPYYDFRLELPQSLVGRAMTDIEKMYGNLVGPFMEGSNSVLTGSAPVACMQNYQKEVNAYSRGEGKLTLTLGGYKPCHNTEEVCEKLGYDPNRDTRNPASSVFCAHGAGFIVEWDQVEEYMHLPGRLLGGGRDASVDKGMPTMIHRQNMGEEVVIGTDEIDEIINRTYRSNVHGKDDVKRWSTHKSGQKKVIGSDAITTYVPQKKVSKEKYLLVDGYNIIYALPELKELAEQNVDAARGKLLDLLCNYQGVRKCQLIVVFDAYRVVGHKTEIFDYHNIHVVYTKEAETADAYIEKFAHENGRKYHVTVATSDGLEQIIIRGQGCFLLSAKELEADLKAAGKEAMALIDEKKERLHNYLLDAADEETLAALRKGEE
ncbi:MAG: TetM/TetW/TetO/TetS family tetracycline resistance ribosomal protection protein [Roseburia sp.]|nr:TetM/TetW/TetO/TetS family tetracycline resistance ribosomal protection protein [Roseburia sp.]